MLSSSPPSKFDHEKGILPRGTQQERSPLLPMLFVSSPPSKPLIDGEGGILVEGKQPAGAFARCQPLMLCRRRPPKP
jgi:hypothetical protein